VRSVFSEDSVNIDRVEGSLPDLMDLDFTLCPDLVQTVSVVLCALGIRYRFTGTQTLRIKETDRISALQNELKKFGYVLTSDDQGSFLAWEGQACEKEKEAVVETYHDHRMAMAFAPLALRYGSIVINDPMVVTKSYPGFWEDLERAGFGIKPFDTARRSG
jgi:3-phosphoshikimate 1-carboxyvinyltransferase